MNIRFLTGRFAVADGAPDARQIGELKAQGIGSVVSLRMAGERGETMAPEDEGAAVEGAGMAWLHFSAARRRRPSVEKTDDFESPEAGNPAPVLIHARPAPGPPRWRFQCARSGKTGTRKPRPGKPPMPVSRCRLNSHRKSTHTSRQNGRESALKGRVPALRCAAGCCNLRPAKPHHVVVTIRLAC